MKLRSLATTFALVTVGCLLGAGPAMAAPIWNLDIHHNETNFPPGGTGQYWFDVNNVGNAPTTGDVTLTVRLPPGLAFQAQMDSGLPDLNIAWECPGAVPGATVVTCVTQGPIPRHHFSRRLILQVAAAPTIPDGTVLTTTATLAGGGAARPVTAAEPTVVSSSPASFGILPESFKMDFFEEDGLTPVRAAGSHPPLLTTAFDFNSVSTSLVAVGGVPVKRESGSVRNVEVDLPPGFLGNPTAVGECTQAQFAAGTCPASSQVGRFDAAVFRQTAEAFFTFSTGIFNLTHPRGAVTDLGFVFAGNPVHIKASLDPANNYAIKVTVPEINESLPPFDSLATIWGVPADRSHDSERCKQFSPGGNTSGGDTSAECSTDHERRPFLTVPARCEGGNVMGLHGYDSWQTPGIFGPPLDYPLPGEFQECDKPRFEPAVAIEPTNKQANTPTGLDVRIHVPQNENPNAVATPPVKRTVVTLPEGMSFSPSFADGLQACGQAQMHLGTNEPVDCPDASRIGEVTLGTPLLSRPAEGSIYLAAQGDNPFGSLFALYLVLHDTEERGILIKLPGKIELDQSTGQITTSFSDTPQFPFEDLTLKFRSGPQAPLVNLPSCGTQTIGARMSSWARPNESVDVSNTYQITEGPAGTPCPSAVARRPFSPQLTAGTLNPSAGSYSPFIFRLSREDSEQELSSVTAVLPPGLSARIAGLTTCSDAAIASISEAEGSGRAQLERPACPASSQVGTVEAGLGAGPSPNYFPGKVYLAGPYKGAPLSLAVVIPGLAGPFDLGTSVVRTAIEVNRETARITAVSDPFPTILHGVILRVRDVRLRMDTPETTLNPTSCEPAAVAGQAFGTGGALAAISDPFRVGDCASLPFKPKLKLRLLGKTNSNAKPRLKAVLTARPGEANIARAQVNLPHSEFIEQSHIRTICTRVQWAAGDGNGSACPKGSIYGRAKAWTPLLAHPLEGYVYLRSNGGERTLPDLVAALDGQIDVALWGKVDSGPNDGIRNTFEVVPDAPVSRFVLEMRGGRRGLLVNSENLCSPKAKRRAIVRFVGHNGKVEHFKPVVQNQCHKRKAKRAGHGRGRAQRRDR